MILYAKAIIDRKDDAKTEIHTFYGENAKDKALSFIKTQRYSEQAIVLVEVTERIQ